MDQAVAWRANAINLAAEKGFRVGKARIDPVALEAEIDGRRERLQPQNLKVLIALARRRGEVVTRPELVDWCWDGRIIGEDVINHAMLMLRKLAARAGGFAIETVPKIGYRLVEQKTAPVATARPVVPALLALVLVLAGIAAALLSTGRSGGQGQPPRPTIAMLPLATAPDPASRQLAVATRNALSRTLAEGSFGVKLVDRVDAGQSSADLLATGNVWRDGSSARVTIRVEEVARRVLVYSQQFEASGADAEVLAERVGAQVAAMLSWTGALMILDRRNPLEPPIASALMKQMILTVEGGDSMRAYQIGRAIARKAPDSAIVQLSLAIATSRVLGSLPRSERAAAVEIGRRAADRARALAPEFGDVYIPGCLLHSPARMAECEDRLRHSMRVDPGSSFAPGHLSTLAYDAGRIDEALRFADVSRANDPYKPAKLARMVRMLEAGGRSAESERLYRAALRWWPGNRRILPSRLRGMVEGGHHAALERALSRPNDEWPGIDATAARRLLAALRLRDIAGARAACADNELPPLTLQLCMTALADLGELNRSFAIAAVLYPASRAPAEADPERVWLDHPDSFDTATLTGRAARSMRTDPRFLDIAQKLGLLAYWRSGRLPDFCLPPAEPVCRQIARP